MKCTLIQKLWVLPLLFMAGTLIAQPPPGLPLQGVAKDPLGNPAKNRKIFVKSSILQKTINGTKVWDEAFEVQSNDDGIYTIIVGQGTRAPGILINNIGEIDWSNGPFFQNLKIAIAPSIPASWWVAADNYIDLGTTQMLSVPYALFAGNASVTNVNQSISSGPPGTFLITDTLGNVNWALPRAANQTETTVTRVTLISTGQDVIIPANTTASVTIKLPGVVKGDPILVSALGDYANWSVYNSYAVADDLVSVRFANYTNAPVNVKQGEYKIVVIK